MKLYYAKVMWYHSDEGNDHIDKMFVFGADLTDACYCINNAFSDIESLTIEEVNGYISKNILYLPDDTDVISILREANDY